jgi:hypothetical protein
MMFELKLVNSAWPCISAQYFVMLEISVTEHMTVAPIVHTDQIWSFVNCFQWYRSNEGIVSRMSLEFKHGYLPYCMLFYKVSCTCAFIIGRNSVPIINVERNCFEEDISDQ